MPDIDKLIQKMKRQPNGIRFQELAKVLDIKISYETILKQRRGTSHRNLYNGAGDVITI